MNNMNNMSIAIPEPEGTHIMLDLETLGLQQNSLILSIGMVVFNNTQIIDKYYQAIDPVYAQLWSMHIDANTVMWWIKEASTNKEAADAILYSNRKPAYTALTEAIRFINKHGIDSDVRMWSNGADFDAPILASAINKIHESVKIPWQFKYQRCFRTVKSLHDDIAKPEQEGPSHHALYDAINQVKHLQAIVAAGRIVLK